METSLSVFTNPLVLVALVGMFSHFLKRKVKGETFVEILDYFKEHPKNTLLSLIATMVGYFGFMQSLVTGQPVDIFACFAVGYMSDSFFNKFETVDGD